MFFRSAVDPWFYGLAISLPIVLTSVVLKNAPAENSSAFVLVFLAIAALSLVPLWLLFSTYYRVDSVILRIQSGPFSWAVPLEQIRSVTASRSLLSSPALSIKRLKIDYGKQRSIFVSPQQRSAFIEAIGHTPLAN